MSAGPFSSENNPNKGHITIRIVIPTFNRSALLKRAIESVISQTYPHWRLLVVDNASPDDTQEIVSELMQIDTRIQYFRHESNIGMLANWEFAISKIDAEYFSLLCDDDFLLPGFFDSAIREIEAQPELGLCFGVTRVIDDDGNLLSFAPNEMEYGYYKAAEGAVAMMTLQHPATPAVLFRTDCLRSVGGFDRKSLYVADLDIILRVAFRYPTRFFEEQSACYVVHAHNSFKDVSGWHPGLLNLVRNLKKMQPIDKDCLREVFRSFCKHAVMPQLTQFIRKPFSGCNTKTITSAVHCLIEMHMLLEGAARLSCLLVHRVAVRILSGLNVFISVVKDRGLLQASSGFVRYIFRKFSSAYSSHDKTNGNPSAGLHPLSSEPVGKLFQHISITIHWFMLLVGLVIFSILWFVSSGLLNVPRKIFDILIKGNSRSR